MVRFDRAPSCYRGSVTPLLCTNNSCGLVSAPAVSAGSSAGLSALEAPDCIRKTPAASRNPAARCLAIRQLVARLSKSGIVSLPAKHSVAVLVRNGDRILAIRRPDDDDELPGIWGLPAGSFRDSETLEDLIHRIGLDKLGVSLSPIRKLADGAQDRERYRLEMELWEVEMEGAPGKAQWQWTALETLQQGSDQGSLCCRLALLRGI